MKNKFIAGILAIVFGLVGMHKFYLNNYASGFIRLVLLIMFSYLGIDIGIKILWIISLIEGIKLFSMQEDNFNSIYNDNQPVNNNQRPWGKQQKNPTITSKDNPYKKAGIEKYKDYDYQGAIEDFTKALVIEPYDNAIHFNIACAYSLNEDADKAFYHLTKAIEYGYSDFDKLKTHEGLAFIRTSSLFEAWLNKNTQDLTSKQKEVKEELPDLLEQIKTLNEKRERGELKEEEFLKERKKLMG